jgi:glycosyltransferase involved in cell wall biosynthesis
MNSGYSIVATNLAIGLKRLGYEVSHTGLQTAYCPEYYDDGNGGQIEVMPIQSDKAEDIGQFMNNLQNVSPDTVIFIGQMDLDLNPLAKLFPGTIAYVPIEGRDVPLGIVNDLNKIVSKGGKVVAMCQYAYNEMIMAGVHADRWIYHGYDDKVFKKIDINKEIKNNNENNENNNRKEEIVSILKWSSGSTDDKTKNRWVQYDIEIDKVGDLLGYGKRFIYLHVGQNILTRKRQERLLAAYAIMIRESRQLRDHTILHMHCLPISGRGLNLIEVTMKLGIKENVSFSYGSYLAAGWSAESLNILYNLADVHVSASSSEGFGIPTIESMACGLPNIAPDCTSFTELIGKGNDKDNDKGDDRDDNPNRGLLAKIESWQMEPIGRFKGLVSQEHLAILMKRLYVDKKLRERLGSNGMEWVPQWTWDNIVDKWSTLFKN